MGITFLIDSGSDQTVFSMDLFLRLGFPITPVPPGSTLLGIGGQSDYTEVDTMLELRATDGGPVHFPGLSGRAALFRSTRATSQPALGLQAQADSALCVSN